MGAHAPLTRSLNLSFTQGSEPSEESGSEDDVPSVRRMLKLQQAESEEASEDEADAKVLKVQNRAEALHDSAAPSDALVEQEVNMLTHVCEALHMLKPYPCNIGPRAMHLWLTTLRHPG